mmetsp:Transcript_87555/g.283467  ORF Transcript_87555/g.283467 Transcript_87555/m.283467 type:complete len:332 (+) Transcript_87555:584-1579(+)
MHHLFSYLEEAHSLRLVALAHRRSHACEGEGAEEWVILLVDAHDHGHTEGAGVEDDGQCRGQGLVDLFQLLLRHLRRALVHGVEGAHDALVQLLQGATLGRLGGLCLWQLPIPAQPINLEGFDLPVRSVTVHVHVTVRACGGLSVQSECHSHRAVEPLIRILVLGHRHRLAEPLYYEHRTLIGPPMQALLFQYICRVLVQCPGNVRRQPVGDCFFTRWVQQPPERSVQLLRPPWDHHNASATRAIAELQDQGIIVAQLQVLQDPDSKLWVVAPRVGGRKRPQMKEALAQEHVVGELLVLHHHGTLDRRRALFHAVLTVKLVLDWAAMMRET